MRIITARHDGAKYRAVYLVICLAILLLFFLVKFGGSFAVDYLFEHGRTDILDRLAPSLDGPHPVTYYRGSVERNILGPVSQVLAFSAFLIFALRFLKRSSAWMFGTGVFIFLMITKTEVLFFPPYGDAIGGPFAEAWWLANNHFNYAGLFHQPDYAQGGPRVYLFSIYPTYAALWMKLLGNPRLYLPVMHMIVFGMISATAVMLREISRKIFSEKTALLTASLFLSLPLVQSQAESLNMEPPCLFFVTLSAFFLVYKRVWPAALAAVGAVLIKGTGIMACGAVGAVSLFLFCGGIRQGRKPEYHYIGVIVLMAMTACLKLFSKYFIGDAHVSAGMVGMFNGMPSLKILMCVRWFLAALTVYVLFSIFRFNKNKQFFFETGTMYLYAVLFFFILMNFSAVSPRYTLSVYPFLVFSVVYAGSLILNQPRIQAAVLTAAVITAAFFSYGYGAGETNDHVMLERSLEYRNDFYLDRQIVKTIESEFQTAVIGAPMQTAQILGIKEFGYTQKDLDVFMYGFSCRYGGIGTFRGLKHLDIRRTVFIGKMDDGDRKDILVPEYPMAPEDFVLKKLQYGEKNAWIFMGGYAIEKMYRMVSHIVRQKHQKKIQSFR